ncbi:MAG TPA: antitoxin MazE family protein [Allosphingosinicella sp.]|nr:antitoxin MazE family protein [Allosphingosinicella sp.]
MNKPTPVPGRERVARRRAALRAQGLRPKQFWVPDVHSAEFKEQARLASLAVANSPHEAEHQAWIDSVYAWDSLPPYDAPLDD